MAGKGARPDAPSLDALPEQLGPCRIIRQIGAGAMGAVYLGRLEEHRPWAPPGSAVAVKVLRPELLHRRVILERFRREAEVGMSLTHPAVVRIYEALSHTAAGTTYHVLLQEYVEGRTLQELVAELTTVPEPLLRNLGAQIARGLQAVHSAGAVHRDVKPANILVTPTHQVKLMDLGLAHILDESHELTQDEHFVGTLLYAAPEQIEGGEVGPAIDLYALGIVLYLAASGVQPFAAESVHRVMWRHLNHVPPPLDQINPRVSRFFSELVTCLLDKNPVQRFASAADLASTLEAGETSAWWVARERSRASARTQALRHPFAVPRETQFVGREELLGELHGHYREARAGQGRIVLLEGELGVGKTRLLDELVVGLGRAGERSHILYGACVPGGGAGARGALAQALVTHFGESVIEEALGYYLTGMPSLVPGFAAFLGGREAPAGSEPLSSDRLHAVFCRLARELAAERPLVWIAEDLHFARPDELGHLLSLARIAHDQRLFLVATTRPQPPGPERLALERLDRAHSYMLPRLDSAESTALLSQLPGPPGLAADVARRAGGNPFFLLEMLREQREGGGRSGEVGGDADVAAQASVDVPRVLRDLLLARLAELDEGDRHILDAAAVQGANFDPEIVAGTVGRGRLDVLQRLAALERRAGVVRATGAGFAFDHQLLQELIYQALPPLLAQEYHECVAVAYAARAGIDGLEPERVPGPDAVFLGEHLLRGPRPVEGARLALVALHYLAAQDRNDALLGLAGRALAVLGDREPQLRCDLRLAELDCLDVLARREIEHSHFEDAIAAAAATGDHARKARSRYRLGRYLYRSNQLEGAEAELTAALALAPAASDPETEASIHHTLGGLHKALGRYAAAREHLERSFEIARTAGDRRGEAQAILLLGNVFLDFDELDPARALFERALAIARAAGLRQSEALAIGSLGLVFEKTGRYERARHHLGRALALCRQIGIRRAEAASLSNLGAVEYDLGRYREARERLLAYLALGREIGSSRFECTALLNLGFLDVEEGRLEDGESKLRSQLKISREQGMTDLEAHLLLGLGELARARQDDASEHARFAEALELFRELRQRHGIALAACGLGRQLALSTGSRERAVPYLLEAEALVGALRLGAPGPLPSAYLAWLGERDPDTVAVEPTTPAMVQAEAHAVLFRISGEDPHLLAGREILGRLSSHLGTEERERMRRANPVARLLEVERDDPPVSTG